MSHNEDMSIKRVSGSPEQGMQITPESDQAQGMGSDELRAQQLEQAGWEFDDTKATREKGEHLDKMPKTDKKSIEDQVQTGKSDKSKEHKTHLVLFRKDLDSFLGEFLRKYYKYKLPEENLQKLLNEILAFMMSKDRIIRREKGAVPLPAEILRKVLQAAKDAGSADSAQIDMIFEFLLAATELEESLKGTPEAKEVNQLRANIVRARDDYRAVHGKEIETGHAMIDYIDTVINKSEPAPNELNASEKMTEVAEKMSEVRVLSSTEKSTQIKEVTSRPMAVPELLRRFDTLYDSYPAIRAESKVLFEAAREEFAELKDATANRPALVAVIDMTRNVQAFESLNEHIEKKEMPLAFKMFEQANRPAA